MKCDDVELLLPEYVDGTLTAAETQRVREHLGSCPACAREAEAQRRLGAAFRAVPPLRPTPRLTAVFETWLEAEREAASLTVNPRLVQRSSWLRIVMGNGASALAACILFAAGLLIGARVLADRDGAARDAVVARELAQVRSEMAAMNQAVTWTLLQQQSASERLQTVLAFEASPAGAPALQELLGVLAFDSSTTVRRSAVEALYRYAGDATVRRAIAHALPRETSPVVQLAMIDLLASTRDPAAASALATFARSETPDTAVRDAASYALARM